MWNRLRRCPYCGQKIKQEAIKCRYCGEFSERGSGSSTCAWCRMMMMVGVALLLIWLVVFLRMSGSG